METLTTQHYREPAGSGTCPPSRCKLSQPSCPPGASFLRHDEPFGALVRRSTRLQAFHVFNHPPSASPRHPPRQPASSTNHPHFKRKQLPLFQRPTSTLPRCLRARQTQPLPFHASINARPRARSYQRAPCRRAPSRRTQRAGTLCSGHSNRCCSTGAACCPNSKLRTRLGAR